MAARRLYDNNPFPNSFIGGELCPIDNRGRSKFPAKFRRMLSPESENRLVVAPGNGDYLIAFPRDAWEGEQSKYNYSPYADEEDLDEQHWRYHYAEEVILDSQGRIIVPRGLLDRVGIGTEMVIVAMRHWFEIWNPQMLADYRKRMEEARRRKKEKRQASETG